MTHATAQSRSGILNQVFSQKGQASVRDITHFSCNYRLVIWVILRTENAFHA